jgi:hypothetical protein
MSTNLVYSKLPNVKLGMWSIKQKIQFAIGYTPTMWSSGSNTNVQFSEDLTQPEIDAVNDIVNDPNAQGPDVDLQIINNSYIIRDIWAWRNQIAIDAGIDFSMWYQSSETFGSNVMDEIVVIPTDSTHTAQRLLTNPEKNALETALTDGNRWE